eukprot:6477275-Amphidinium_carterae.1
MISKRNVQRPNTLRNDVMTFSSSSPMSYTAMQTPTNAHRPSYSKLDNHLFAVVWHRQHVDSL